MDRSRNIDVPSPSNSSKKAARKQHKIQKARKPVDNTQKKSIDSKPDSKPSDVLRKHIESLQEKSESSHSSDLPQEQLEKLIEAKKQGKVDFIGAFSGLQTSIEEAKQKIEKILKDKNLSREDAVDRQLKAIGKFPYLMDLISKDVNYVTKNKEILNFQFKYRLNGIKEIVSRYQEVDQSRIDACIELFHSFGIDPNDLLPKEYQKKPEERLKSFKFFTIDTLTEISGDIRKIGKIESYRNAKNNEFLTNPVILDIYRIKTEKESRFFQEVKDRFVNAIHEDDSVVREAFKKTLREWPKDTSTLQPLKSAYLEQLQYNSQKSGQKVDKDAVLEEFKKALDSKKPPAEQSQDQQIEEIAQCLDGLKKGFQYKELKKRLDENISSFKEKLKNHPEILENIENEKDILEKGVDIAKNYLKNITTSDWQPPNFAEIFSFYDLLEKNLEYHLSNSLDELARKSQEALRLFDEEIKKLEWLHSQKLSELSDQPQVAMEKPSPADKLQTYLETAFKDPDITPQRRHIVTSYLSDLFEKSHHQSLDDATIAKFYQKHIEEAKQVGEYIEQKYFVSDKIRYDAIQLAVHLKHAFGFPIHDATIDKDFNIVRSRPSKDGSSSTPSLDIDRQGRILKDGRVQRVYLIGFQDPPEASSSHTQPKPKALFAIQSADTGYLKYGAGTPLPIGGVVDIVTARHTTRKQPNLYKATLAIETLQETHNQKEIDPQTLVVSPGSVGKPKMLSDKPASSGRSPLPLERETAQTLELFESETVMRLKRSSESSSKTSSQGFEKIPIYDVTTFVGKVKDRPHQATPQNSGEYRETTGPCMVNLDELISTVKQELGLPDHFRPSQIVMKSLKRQIARQVLGEDAVPKSDQEWKENGAICWADFHEYSTSMNMFAKYLVLAYREELGLAGSK